MKANTTTPATAAGVIFFAGGVTRYSDDGEPQGTAGQPMLEVFRREGVENVCCVVTRYFGGILLGTGGLLRAYTKSAKDALAEAGVAVVRQWARTAVECPYNLLERMKLEIAAAQGILGRSNTAPRCASPPCCPWSTGRPMKPGSQSSPPGRSRQRSWERPSRRRPWRENEGKPPSFWGRFPRF